MLSPALGRRASIPLSAAEAGVKVAHRNFSVASRDKASLVDQEVSDWVDAGCGCEGENHYGELHKDALVSYVCSVREITKAHLKQFVLG